MHYKHVYGTSSVMKFNRLQIRNKSSLNNCIYINKTHSYEIRNIYVYFLCVQQFLPILIVMNFNHCISFTVIFSEITYYYFVICENEKNNDLLMKT